MQGKIRIRGVFGWTLSEGKSGLVIARGTFRNAMTTEGLTACGEAELGGGTQVTTWYMGLINNAGFTALAAGDTMSSHAGWAELTNYGESTRPSVTFGTTSAGVITTTATSDYTISGSRVLKGAFLASNSTKGGTTGILRATGSFPGGTQSMSDGQIFSLNYTSTYAAG